MPIELPKRFAWAVPGTEVVTVSRQVAIDTGIALHISESEAWLKYWDQPATIIDKPDCPGMSHGAVYVAIYYPGFGDWSIYCDWIVPVSLSPKDLLNWIRKERHG